MTIELQQSTPAFDVAKHPEHVRVGYRVMEEVIQSWELKCYAHYLSLAQDLSNEPENVASGTSSMVFHAVFSILSENKPVPTAVVHCHFGVKLAPTDDGSPDDGELRQMRYFQNGSQRYSQVIWRFENQCMEMKAGQCIPACKVEQWLDRIVQEKMIARQTLDLTTDFERPRLEPPQIEVRFLT